MRNGILYHKNEIQEVNHPNRNTMQLVLPKPFRKQALQCCHDDLGHLGIEWTKDLLRDQFYWPRMMEDTVKHIKQCERSCPVINLFLLLNCSKEKINN